MRIVTKLGIGIALLALWSLFLFGFPTKFVGLVAGAIAGWQICTWIHHISDYFVNRLYPEQ